MKHTKGRPLHKTNRKFRNTVVVNVPSEKSIVYWLNSLGLPSSILVDSLDDLSRQGDDTIAEVVQELLSTPGKSNPKPRTVASALTLLSKHPLWNEMSPSLSKLTPVDIALNVQQNNGEILKLLMGNLRMLMERKNTKVDNGTAPRKSSSPSAFGRTNSSKLGSTSNRQKSKSSRGSSSIGSPKRGNKPGDDGI